MSVPSSKIFACSGVRLTNAYDHTIWFADPTAQQAYFAGKVANTFTGYTYLRKNWDIDVAVPFDTARKWSYLFFQNSDGKYWYYFVTNIEYKSDSMTKIRIELDVMQTYMFEYERLPCLVEREHAASDAVGGNLVQENLELGEYKDAWTYDVGTDDLGSLVPLVMTPYSVKKVMEEGTTAAGAYVFGTRMDGLYSGMAVYKVTNTGSLSLLIDELNDVEGGIDGIFYIWMYPSKLLTDYATQSDDYTGLIRVGGTNPVTVTLSLADIDEGYTPRNKKLLTYPYRFLYASNNSGATAIYHLERFTAPDTPKFAVYGAVAADATTKLIPCSYKGVARNHDESIPGQGYPSCAWFSDSYKLWLAQNQNNLANQEWQTAGTILVGAATVIAGVATGGIGALGVAGAVMAGGGMLGAGINQALNLHAQKKDAQLQPPTSKGQHSASVNHNSGALGYRLAIRRIRDDQMQRLDEFFDMYGYATNRVKVPNTHSRPVYTYTKTAGCKIKAPRLCTDDVRKIEQIFDHGITFWMDGDQVGNYDSNNRGRNAL